MNKMQTSLPMWNALKRPAKILAAIAVASALGSVAQAQITYTPTFTNVWVVAPGAYPGIPPTGNNCRGIAINPLTTNVLYFSSTGGTNNGNSHVGTLSFASGSNYLANLNSTGISGGTVGTAGIRASDDGFIYACNVSGAPASNFKIYRWASDTDVTTAPAIVYNSGSGTSFQWRLGDYIDVRGSGVNTEIVAVGPGSGANITTNFVIFRPTDAYCTNFTNFSITIPGPATLNVCGGGVAFEGTNNAIWIRRAGSQETRRVAYDPIALSASISRTNLFDQSVCQGLKYYTANGVQLLATVQASTTAGAAQIARVMQVPASANPTVYFASVLSSNIPAVAGSANGNGLGNVDARNGYFLFGAPGHGLSLFNIGFVTNSPPAVTISSSASTLVAGYNLNATFTGTASGSSPLKYQWYFTDSATFTNAIPTGTTNVYTATNVQTANAGGYFVIVTNLYGKATSSVANINVLPNGGSALAKPLWTVAPGAVDYITGAGTDTQRGMAYDPLYQRLVVVSRYPTNGVHLLDAATGADQGDLDISPLLAITPPGTFALNMCGVANDGAVYVGNLITSASSDSFAIYRWNSATNTEAMGQAYAGNPLGDLGTTGGIGRIGDTMAVRGAGADTQIICTFRNGTNAAIFTTTDGYNFTCNIIAITNLAASIGATDPFTGNSPIGLGLAWGTGNTFWAKSSSYNLRQISFDLASGTGAVLGSYPLPTTEAPLGVDIANGYVALIGTIETPVNVPIYNLNLPAGPTLGTLADREVFGANNANGNGTGAVAFDLAGGRLFALSSNSGLLALTYAGKLAIKEVAGEQILTWNTPSSVLQSSVNVAGPYLDVSGATSPYTNNVGSMQFFRLRH